MKKKAAIVLAAALLLQGMPVHIAGYPNPMVKTVKAASALGIVAESNTVVIGQRNEEIADIILKEGTAGAFKKNKTLYLRVENLNLEDTITCEVIVGNLKVKKAEVEDGILKITIDKESTKPSQIKISGLALYLDDRTPEGSYALELVTEESAEFKNNAFGGNYSEDGKGNTFDVKYLTLKEDFIYAVLPKNNPYKDEDDLGFATKIVLHVQEGVMLVNDKPANLEVPPYISEGRVMMPVRDISEALSGSATVTWDEKTQTVNILFGKNVVNMTVGSKTMVINATEAPMSGEVQIREGRAFIPMRDLGMALGIPDAEINWDEETKTATYF